MNKLIKSLLTILLAISFLGINEIRAEEPSIVTEINITLDTDKVVLIPSLSGSDVSSRIHHNTTIPDNANYYVYNSNTYTYVCYKEAGEYISLGESDALLTSGKDYYICFNVEENDGASFDPDNLPTATVNSTVCEATWRSNPSENGDINVYYPLAFQADGQCVISVKLNSNEKNVQVGTSYQFSVAVKGNPQTVDWILTNNDSPNTTITDGLLEIAADEPVNKALLVRAQSTIDSDCYDIATVHVISDAPYIEKVSFDKSYGNLRCEDAITLSPTIIGTAEKTLEWTMSGNTSDDTTLYVFNNTLSARITPEDEPTGTIITITATSLFDSTKKAIYRLTIIDKSVISKVAITTTDKFVIDSDTRACDLAGMIDSDHINPVADTTKDYYVYNGDSYTYVMQKVDDAWAKVTHDEPLDYEGEYRMRLNIENKSYSIFDTAKLPAVTINGKTAASVAWKSQTADGDIDVDFAIPNFKTNFTSSKPTAKVSSNDYQSIKLEISNSFTGEGFKIYRATSKTGKYKLINATTTNTYVDNGLTSGKTYYYKVVGYVDDGLHNYVTKTSSICYATVKPGKVENVEVTNNHSSSVDISWDAVNGASGYYVYRATKEKGTYSLVKTIKGGTNTSCTITKLSANKAYYYRIYAYKTVSKKNIKGTVSDTVMAKSAYSAPKLTLKTIDGRVDVNSTFTRNAIIHVERSDDNGVNYSEVATHSCYVFPGEKSTTIQYNDFAANTFGKTYKYRAYATYYDEVDYCTDYYYATVKLLPDTPTVTLSTASKSVTISYSFENTAGYAIYRSTKKSSGYKLICTDEENVLSYTDSTKKGTTYYYKVRSFVYASDGITKIYSDYSSVKSIKSK